jgi:hypothetical protein
MFVGSSRILAYLPSWLEGWDINPQCYPNFNSQDELFPNMDFLIAELILLELLS